jgi:hypothetical protein
MVTLLRVVFESRQSYKPKIDAAARAAKRHLVRASLHERHLVHASFREKAEIKEGSQENRYT